jgi:hypothetical protein
LASERRPKVIVCHTACYGNFDTPKPRTVDHAGIERWVFHTDDPDLEVEGWEMVYAPSRFKAPRLAAKWWKCHPPEADASIWVDQSMDIHDPTFFSEMIKGLNRADLAIWDHPGWRGIVREAHESLLPKWEGQPMLEMTDYYIREWGFTSQDLYASTTFGINHTQTTLAFLGAWFAECERLHHDQISLPPLVERYGLSVYRMPGATWGNPWFWLHAHTYGDR